jgi:quercetin dioxygenase-like cupin family protein
LISLASSWSAVTASVGTPSPIVEPSSAPAQSSAFKRTILQRADVAATNLELIIATVDIAAVAKAGRHMHPGMIMAYVVDGDFWLHVDGQPEQILHAGESTSNPDRAIHDEGALDNPVRLHSVYVVEKGKPHASPAQLVRRPA